MNVLLYFTYIFSELQQQIFQDKEILELSRNPEQKAEIYRLIINDGHVASVRA